MSASLHDSVPSAIAPHLLHSPVNSPSFDQHNLLDAYRDNAPDSPHSLGYSQSPAPDSNNFQHQEPHPPVTKSITSPGGMLVVYSYDPASAPPGAGLTAQVDFTNFSGANVRLRIVFGDLALPTSVSPNVPLQQREPGHERGDWKLRITVPPVGQASTNMAEMGTDGRLEWPLTLQALNSGGQLLDTIAFGFFSYESVSIPPKMSSPSTIFDYENRSPNKRPRQLEDDGECSPSPSKRLTVDTDFRRMPVINCFLESPHYPIAHRAFLDTSPTSLSPLRAGMSIPPQALKQHLQPPNHPELQVDTRHCDTHSQPPLPLPEITAVPSSPGVHSDDSPALIRTSQLGHDAKPEQASVAIQGDLENMKRGWSESEYAAGRRLVQFWKRQIGTTLHISFGGISQNDYKDNTIVVSCIYRGNVDEYFITSVDVIYLLEALAGNRFEVEEKNRIRRNLEGFKPMTISKSKQGTEEFFRVIMELPPPRPRNIEKDVKVFDWGKLKMMLEKVFSKYSTVPVSQDPPSPKYDGLSRGLSNALYSFPKPIRGSSAELPNLSVPPVGVRPRTQKRHSPIHGARLRDIPPLPPLHTSLQNQNSSPMYPEDFPPRYNDYNGFSIPGMQLFEVPILDHTGTPFNLKPDFAHGHMSAPTGSIVGRHQDGFRSGSPPSCDNSPLSMTLSISSRTSSEGGHVENQDLAATPVVPGAAEPMQIPHRQL